MMIEVSRTLFWSRINFCAIILDKNQFLCQNIFGITFCTRFSQKIRFYVEFLLESPNSELKSRNHKKKHKSILSYLRITINDDTSMWNIILVKNQFLCQNVFGITFCTGISSKSDFMFSSF